MDFAELAIAAGGLIVAILAYFVGRRTLTPPARELRVTIDDSISVIPAEHAGTALIEVRSGGSMLADPYITTVHVDIAGTHDISMDMFEAGNGIVFDAPAGAVLIESAPATVCSSLTGGRLTIGPSLLKVGSKVKLSLLTDGRPALSLPYVPIPNVKCIDEKEDRGRRERRTSNLGIASGVVATTLFAIGVVGMKSAISSTTDAPPGSSDLVPWIYFPLASLPFVALLVATSFLQSLRRSLNQLR